MGGNRLFRRSAIEAGFSAVSGTVVVLVGSEPVVVVLVGSEPVVVVLVGSEPVVAVPATEELAGAGLLGEELAGAGLGDGQALGGDVLPQEFAEGHRLHVVGEHDAVDG